MKLPTSDHILYVPRDLGHVKVILTLVHNTPNVDTIHANLLDVCARILTNWKALPDKCEVVLSTQDVFLQLLKEEMK